jgi:hypothetical protein
MLTGKEASEFIKKHQEAAKGNTGSLSDRIKAKKSELERIVRKLGK